MLITPDELAASLDEPDVTVIDCRFDLLNPDAGREAWLAEHIPGAFYADLDKHLAAPISADSGRHPLPDPEQFAALLGRWGVTPETRVVAYDASGGAVAARLWWLLRWIGHERIALLDGGFPAWLEARLPVNNVSPQPGQGRYPVNPGCMPVISADELQLGLADGSLYVVDARDQARFAGEVEPIDTLAGHIPGANNRPFQVNLDATGRFRARADLYESFGAMAIEEGQRVAAMCGSGVTACHNLFAMELADAWPGNGGQPALYAGSWSEWIRSGKRPVAGAGQETKL
jgi:thiosulfate/3-mercaptopyruvate sulfurtransferase